MISSIHISAGGVAPIPLYLENTSKFLLGRKITRETLFESLPIIQSEISPITDIRGSAEYKRLLLNQLFKAHFIELFPELINVEALI
jgi:xanthine dehydrogenase small subunit